AEAKISRHFGTLSPGRARPREWSGTAPPVASGGLKCITQRIVGTYCRAKMNARPIISFHAVGGLLTPPSAPTTAFDLHYGNLSPVRRLMRTAGFGVIATPGTQYGPRKRDSGLTPAGCAGRRRRSHLGAGQTGWPAGTASRRPRAMISALSAEAEWTIRRSPQIDAGPPVAQAR